MRQMMILTEFGNWPISLK